MAEDRAADTHMRRTDLDCFFIIAAHAHRERGDAIALGDFSEQCEMR